MCKGSYNFSDWTLALLWGLRIVAFGRNDILQTMAEKDRFSLKFISPYFRDDVSAKFGYGKQNFFYILEIENSILEVRPYPDVFGILLRLPVPGGPRDNSVRMRLSQIISVSIKGKTMSIRFTSNNMEKTYCIYTSQVNDIVIYLKDKLRFNIEY